MIEPGLVMTWVAFALVGAIIAWSLWPLAVGVPEAQDDDPRLLGLLIAREAALSEVRDLDDLLAADRLGQRDHAARRAAALERGARALHALDQLRSERSVSASEHARRIEAELARRLGAEPGTEAPGERAE